MNDFTVNIERKISRLGQDIREFVEKIAPMNDLESDFSPACDIVDSGNELRILMDLPGVEKDQIRISLKDQVLRISGERQVRLGKNDRMKRSERKSGVFSRSFAIPEWADSSGISAAFKSGVLTISIPKPEHTDEGQSIPVS